MVVGLILNLIHSEREIGTASVSRTQLAQVVDLPATTPANKFYVSDRLPLTPAPFATLPTGQIQAKDWLEIQLQNEAKGFFGHLTEISPYLKAKNNAWLSPVGEGDHPWEETPYWLRGFVDLGPVLHDKKLTAEGTFWVNGILGSQREDGYFGPRANLKSNDGTPDVWPNMLALQCLQNYAEAKPDPRVLPFMKRYFQWELNLPEDELLKSYWEVARAGDNIGVVEWYYNRTGDKGVLPLIDKLHRRNRNWVGNVPDGHGVNYAQGFREPAQYGLAHNFQNLLAATEKDYSIYFDEYGQVPGGMYGADEQARKGYTDPRQAAETCAMVEMMNSDEWLLEKSGQPTWAQRCENVAFNSLPAALTPDQRALHYLTAPNMPQLDSKNHSPGINNGGKMLAMDPNDYRCCQHNEGMGWPYFTKRSWMATAGNGLAAVLLAPTEVTAKVGTGQTAKILETTHYPFSGVISFNVKVSSPSQFPLYIRIPDWAASASLSVGGRTQKLACPNHYIRINRRWHSGDTAVLTLPMAIKVDTYAAQKGAVSVSRGPLTYSLKIGESVIQDGGTPAWPGYDILPTTAWNYGILPQDRIEVKVRPYPTGKNPFDPQFTPIELVAKGREIPQWTFDHTGLAAVLQASPAATSAPVKNLALIPMGAARLRISCFPTVTQDGSGTPWIKPQQSLTPIPAKASFESPYDTLDALTDGFIPSNPDDQTISRFTFWDHKGTAEWVELDYPKPITSKSVSVYWFEDAPDGGGCKIPQSWKLSFWNGNEWQEVNQTSDITHPQAGADSFAFTEATAQKWRLDVQLQPNFSGGILEWQLKP